jgi:hypothetical protein
LKLVKGDFKSDKALREMNLELSTYLAGQGCQITNLDGPFVLLMERRGKSSKTKIRYS